MKSGGDLKDTHCGLSLISSKFCVGGKSSWVTASFDMSRCQANVAKLCSTSLTDELGPLEVSYQRRRER